MTPPNLPRWGRDIIILIGTFVLVQTTFSVLRPTQFQGNDSSDFRDFYYPIAKRLAGGRSLIEAQYFEHAGLAPAPTPRGTGILVTRFPPGYPVLLSYAIRSASLLGTSDIVAFTCVTWVFSLATCLLLYLIFGIFLGDRFAAWLGSIVWMIYPPALFLTKQPNSENPFLVFVMLAVVAQLACKSRLHSAFAVGICLGIAMYIRQAGLFLPFVFVTITFAEHLFTKRRDGMPWLAAAIILFLPYALVTPWVWQVYREIGKFVPMASTGRDLMTVGYGEMLRSIPAESWMWGDASHSYTLHRAANGADLSLWMEMRILPLRIMRAFYGTFTLRQERLLAVLQALYFGMAGFGFAKTFKDRSKAPFHMAAWSLFTYFLATSFLGIPLLRYTLPGQILLAGYVAIGMIVLAHRCVKLAQNGVGSRVNRS